MGVDTREIGYMFGQYMRLVGHSQGSFTGPRINWSGSSLRTEATGYGLVFFAQFMLADMNKRTERAKILHIYGLFSWLVFVFSKALLMCCQWLWKDIYACLGEAYFLRCSSYNNISKHFMSIFFQHMGVNSQAPCEIDSSEVNMGEGTLIGEDRKATTHPSVPEVNSQPSDFPFYRGSAVIRFSCSSSKTESMDLILF